MNFRTDTTKGGYKILSIHGPDANGWYAGVLEKAGDIGTVTWNQHGNSTGDMRDLDLIPLADEPEPSETTELWNEIEALREITVETLKRMNEMRTDYIARVNGLRNDYLADQSAVQPSRVDALEERLEALEQRTQPSEKGVWVTRESLKRAFDATQEFLIRNDRFEEIADHLGLEE